MNYLRRFFSTLSWNQTATYVVCIVFLFANLILSQQTAYNDSQKRVAEYVKNKILDGDFGERTLWMTTNPLDQSHVARNYILDKQPDLPFPYKLTWLVMIDDNPDANFGHPVRWVFINAQLTENTKPIVRDFPPLILSELGEGKAVEIRCIGITPKACPEVMQFEPPKDFRVPLRTADECLYAVLVSGGVNASKNYNRYRQNLRSMYQILSGAGYKKSNIYVYYADGTALDLDNEDGDNNDATGSDVTADADESLIRTRIQQLCANLNSNRDILFLYFSNHGADNNGICLWDGNGNGLEQNELYTPAELSSDTENSNVCRLFMIHDQCYSGEFLSIANDGKHDNLAVYASASASESSWGREYMARWEQNNFSTTTLNDMHIDVVNNGNLTSTPGMAEGTLNLGSNFGNLCCRLRIWTDWIWGIIIIVVIVIVVYVVIKKRRR